MNTQPGEKSYEPDQRQRSAAGRDANGAVRRDVTRDAAMMAHLLEEEGPAFRQVHDELAAVIRRACRQVGFTGAALGDAVQEVWIHLRADNWRIVRLWTGAGALDAFVARGARNKAVDLWRAARRRREVALDPSWMGIPAPERDGDDAAAREAFWERLEESLQALRPADRAIILMRFHEDCSYAELAARLGRNLSYVGATLRRALARLKDAIERRAAAPAPAGRLFG